MTREEFEALLKMEGMWLEVRPLSPAQRSQKYKNKSNTLWDAIVWEPMKMGHLVIHPQLAISLGIDLEDLLDDYVVNSNAVEKTNTRAVKEIIKYYLERVQKRADN
jgi:hypothetical protein